MSQSINVTFEVHTYDGGFKPELIPAGRRPNYLPDATGPNSTELELSEGDFAFELVQTSRAGKCVTWIGCFTAGIDRQLGPRGNYCGVGVWLVDLAPIYVGRLVKLLRDGTVEIARNSGITEHIRERFQVLAVDLANVGWFVPLERLPGQFWKGRFSHSGTETVYFSTPDNDDHALAVVAGDILRHFVARSKAEEVPHSRSLYLRKSSSKLPTNRLQELDVARIISQEEDIVWDLCEAVHDPITKQNELLRSLERLQAAHEKDVSEARGEIATLVKRVNQLDEELKISESSRADIERIFETVSQCIPNIRLVPTSIEGHGQIDTSAAELARVMKDFSKRLDAITHKLNAPNWGGSATLPFPPSSSQNTEIGKATDGWIRIAAYALCALAAVIILLILANIFKLREVIGL